MPTIRPLSPWTQITDNPFQVPTAPTPDANTNMLVNVAFPPGHMAGQAQCAASAANPNAIAYYERRFRRDFEVVAEPEDRLEDLQASVRHSLLAQASVILRGGRDFAPRTILGRPVGAFGAAVPLTATANVGVSSEAVITEQPGGSPIPVLPGAGPLFQSSIGDSRSPSQSTPVRLPVDATLRSSKTGTVRLVPEARYTLELETIVTVYLSAPVATAGAALALGRARLNALAFGSVNVGWPNPPPALPGAGVFLELNFPERVPIGFLFGIPGGLLGDRQVVVDENGEPIEGGG